MTKKLVFKRAKTKTLVSQVNAAKTRQKIEQEKLRKWAKGINVSYPSKKATKLFESTSDKVRLQLVDIVLTSMALSDSIRRANGTLLELGMEDVALQEGAVPRQLNKLIDLKIFLILLDEMNLDESTLQQVKQYYIESKFVKQDGKKINIPPKEENTFEKAILQELEIIKSRTK